MANYKIIGADLLEYGPVSAEQVRHWISERRVDSETKLQAEGTAEWKPLAEVPEFAEAFPRSDRTTCPKCGEAFENGFDTCWKCGTGRDGSPHWTKQVEVEAEEARSESGPCPKCGSQNVKRGELMAGGHGGSLAFRPEGTHSFILSFSDGVILSSPHNFACLDCGLVWGHLQPDELKEFISKHGSSPHKEDAYGLLSEGGRLESQGDLDGALAKYQAVMEQFPGTGAAGDAEVRIENLKDKMA